MGARRRVSSESLTMTVQPEKRGNEKIRSLFQPGRGGNGNVSEARFRDEAGDGQGGERSLI